MNNQENTASNPYYFHSLTLQNVRCFGEESQTIEFTGKDGNWSNWNIILGENGVGKTTVLCSLSSIEQVVSPRRSKHKHLINLEYFQRNNENPEIYLYFQTNEDNKKHLIDLQVHPEYYSNLYISREDIGSIKIFGYGASRRIKKTSLSEEESNEFLSASLFDDSYPLRNVQEWLLRAELLGRRRNDLTIRDKVEQLIVKLFEGEIHEIKTVEAGLGFGVIVKTDFGWVKLHDLSLGYKTLIAWVVDFASRLFEMHPKSENPFEQPAIVLVDEIDLHMHPKMQQKLIKFLTKTFPNTQFIATAHSPLIVQSAPDANIILLKKVGDHVEVENNPQNIKNWRIDQILTSDLFGLESARSPEIEKLIKERIELNAKFEPNETDKKRLEEINDTIGYLPTAEQPEDIEAMRIIREAAAHLKGKSGS